MRVLSSLVQLYDSSLMDRQRKSARGWRLNSGKRTDGENFVAFRKILTRVSLEKLFLAEFGRFDDSFVRKMASLKKKW